MYANAKSAARAAVTVPPVSTAMTSSSFTMNALFARGMMPGGPFLMAAYTPVASG